MSCPMTICLIQDLRPILIIEDDATINAHAIRPRNSGGNNQMPDRFHISGRDDTMAAA